MAKCICHLRKCILPVVYAWRVKCDSFYCKAWFSIQILRETRIIDVEISSEVVADLLVTQTWSCTQFLRNENNCTVVDGGLMWRVWHICYLLNIIFSKKYHGYLLENRLRFRIHGALQDLECNRYNVPRVISEDENDGSEQASNNSIAPCSTQGTTDNNIVHTESGSTIEIKRFKETSVWYNEI